MKIYRLICKLCGENLLGSSKDVDDVSAQRLMNIHEKDIHLNHFDVKYKLDD